MERSYWPLRDGDNSPWPKRSVIKRGTVIIQELRCGFAAAYNSLGSCRGQSSSKASASFWLSTLSQVKVVSKTPMTGCKSAIPLPFLDSYTRELNAAWKVESVDQRVGMKYLMDTISGFYFIFLI